MERTESTVAEAKKFMELCSKSVNTALIMDKIKFYKGIKITNPEELHKMDVYNNIFIGFVNYDKNLRLARIKKGKERNWMAYVIGKDIYEIYTLNDDITYLNKIELCKNINNNSFNSFSTLSDGFLIVEQNWKNCLENREIFSSNQQKITTLF